MSTARIVFSVNTTATKSLQAMYPAWRREACCSISPGQPGILFARLSVSTHLPSSLSQPVGMADYISTYLPGGLCLNLSAWLTLSTCLFGCRFQLRLSLLSVSSCWPWTAYDGLTATDRHRSVGAIDWKPIRPAEGGYLDWNWASNGGGMGPRDLLSIGKSVDSYE